MRTNYKQDNKDRLRRAKSWLARAENEHCPDEEAFLFLWIAFNAAYGQDYGQSDEKNEHDRFFAFAEQIVACDKRNKIRIALISNTDVIKELTDNEFIFDLFWKFIRKGEPKNWKERLNDYNDKAFAKLGKNDMSKTLNEILFRLYTLRNQIIHGGITFGSEGLGKPQLKSGRKMMTLLVPKIIKIMEQDIHTTPDTKKWGKVAFPRYKETPSPKK